MILAQGTKPIEVEVEKYNSKYVIERAIPNKKFNQYEGLSLDEVERIHGKEKAHAVYRLVVDAGIDLTNPKRESTVNSKMYVRLRIVEKGPIYDRTEILQIKRFDGGWVNIGDMQYNKAQLPDTYVDNERSRMTYRALKKMGLIV